MADQEFAVKIVNFFGVVNVYRLFLIVRSIYMVVDWILETLTGYSLVNGSKAEQDRAECNFEHSAHFLDIKGRMNVTPATICFLKNYILRHNRYGDPREILQNDKITLQGVDETHAWFTVSDVDVYDTKMIPFCFIAQFVTAKQIVMISHATLNLLAEELPGVGRDLIMIHNTARCGSTLLCQMFSNLPETRVMSEPWAFMHSHRMFKMKQLDEREFEKLTEAMIKIQVKPQLGVKRNVVKLSLLNSPLIPIIKHQFPTTKLMFITRHIEASMESFERVLSVIPDPLPSEKGDFWFFYLPFPYEDKAGKALEERYVNQRKTLANIYQLSMGYGGALKVYLENMELYCHALLYEDLVKDPKIKAQAMLEDLKIPVDQVLLALEGLKSDSQHDMFTSVPKTKILNDDDWKISDSLQSQLGLPIKKDMTVEQLRFLITTQR